VRAYSASGEEALRARHLLKDWAGEGLLTEAQYQRMEQETVCEFRRTNIFLRLVLFLFTLLIVAAAVALFFVVVVPNSVRQNSGILLLVFAVVCYGAAEAAVSQARLYRYGIEEALALCSIGFLCAGMWGAFFGNGILDSRTSNRAESLVPAAGAIASLWISRRFGLPYAFLAAMIFAVWLTVYWTSSSSAQHVIVAAFYAAALVSIVAIRPRHRMTYLNQEYSIAEALLWLGIYVAINLQLSSFTQHGDWRSNAPIIGEFPIPFYWATFVLIWCLPPVVLARGLQQKDRLVIAVGAIAAVLTLATNKLYLGWQRHTWDPMLLGVLLTGIALLVRRRLDAAPDGVLRGFTAQRLSGNDKRWLNAGSSVFGVAAPQVIAASPQPDSPLFGGGDSGGGGATSDF